MGTNYYLLSKDDASLESQLSDILDPKRLDNLKEKIQNMIKEEYKDLSKFLLDKGFEEKEELFQDDIEEKVSEFIRRFECYVLDDLSVGRQNKIHIGKSSMGWLFNFQDQKQWHSYKQFRDYITDAKTMKNKNIYDEYGELVEAKTLLKLIDDKQKDKQCLSNPDNFTYCRNVDGYRFSYSDFS